MEFNGNEHINTTDASRISDVYVGIILDNVEHKRHLILQLPPGKDAVVVHQQVLLQNYPSCSHAHSSRMLLTVRAYIFGFVPAFPIGM